MDDPTLNGPCSEDHVAGERPLSREEMIRRFEVWLDGVLADEMPPQGVAGEFLAELSDEAGDKAEQSSTDAFALWSALTGLTQEIKLQGRAFHLLSERAEPLAEASAALDALAAAQGVLSENVQYLAAQLEQQRRNWEREARQEAERRVARSFLEVLVDLYERLRRGMETTQTQARICAGARTGMLARLSGAKALAENVAGALAAHAQGYRLCYERVQDVLAHHGVRYCPSVGTPFDPARMIAIAVEERDDVQEGTVIAELRGGYEWNGDVFRNAEVRVARGRFSPHDEQEKG